MCHLFRLGETKITIYDVYNFQLCISLLPAEIWPRTENAGTYRSSTVLDLVAGQPLEMQYLFGVPLQRAR